MRRLRQSWIAFVLMVMGAAPAPRHAEGTVTVRLFQFAPDTLAVALGTRVTWTNTDDIEHTVTGGEGERADGRFAGLLATKGAAYSFTFDAPGTFPYFCDRHHFMRGVVRVTPS